jgi:hypothetical protein
MQARSCPGAEGATGTVSGCDGPCEQPGPWQGALLPGAVSGSAGACAGMIASPW